MTATLVALAPLVQARCADGKFRHFYAGDPIDVDLDAAHKTMLLREKLIGAPKAEKPKGDKAEK